MDGNPPDETRDGHPDPVTPTTRVRAQDVEAYPVLSIETEEDLQTLFRETGGGSGILPEDIAGAIFDCPLWMLYRHEHLRESLQEIEAAIRAVRNEALK